MSKMEPKIKISEWQKLSNPELQQNINLLEEKMLQYQKQTDYVNAELYRQLHENCQKYMQEKTFEEMQQRHNNQIEANNEARKNKLKEFNLQFQGIFNQFMKEVQTNNKETQTRYANQLQNIKHSIEQQWPIKVKESHQLLNLRKMEAHAANQKNYVQAHSIQTKVDKIYKKQHQQWIEARNNKIETLQNSLRKKQQAQAEVAANRNKLKLEDLQYERVMGQLKINQNFDVKLKELRAFHQREVLSLFGELRNSGGQSPKIKSKRQNENTVSI